MGIVWDNALDDVVAEPVLPWLEHSPPLTIVIIAVVVDESWEEFVGSGDSGVSCGVVGVMYGA